MKIENYDYIGQQRDISDHFYSIGNTYFNVRNMIDFDENTLSGNIEFGRYERKGRMAFNMFTCPFEESKSWTFPPAYSDTPSYPIRFSFTSANVLRIQTTYSNQPIKEHDSIMLEQVDEYTDYCVEHIENGVVLKTTQLHVTIEYAPFSVIIKDKHGKLLTKTINMNDGKCLLNCNPLPFSYVRTVNDMKKKRRHTFSYH